MLATRLTAAMVALVLFTVVTVGSIAYFSLKSSILPYEYERERVAATRQSMLIETAIHRAKDDALILSKSVVVEAYFTARDAKIETPASEKPDVWADRIAANFLAQMASREEYLQMRVLGANGRELVRVDRMGADGVPRRVPEAELQEKGNTAYFQAASKLPASAFYISPINLNREHNKIQEPHIPVVRAAASIRDPLGALQGIVVVNLDLRGLFGQVMANAIPPFETCLVNAEGDFLLHPDPAQTFGFDLGERHRLQDLAPGLQEALDGHEALTRSVEEGGDVFVYALAPVRLEKKELAWVVRRAPEKALLGSTSEVLKSAALGGVAALIGAILLAVALAYSLTKPLNRLTLAIQRFAAGDPNESSVLATGEIGVLANAFDQMRREIREKSEALRLEVEAKARALAEANRLAETERLYGAVVSSTDDAVVTKDLNRVITGWNRGAERLFGYTSQEAVGQKIELIVPPERSGELDTILEKLKRGERVEHFDTVRVAKNGRKVEVSLTISPLRDKDGAVVGASKIARDISEKRRSEERFQLAVEACPSGMVMVNGEGRIVMVNRETERMFGYRRDELTGQPVGVLMPDRYRGNHAGYLAEFMGKPEARQMGGGRELKALRKDGSEFPVEIGLNPIESHGEQLVLAAVLDITERQQAMETIKRANAELEKRVAERTKELQESAEALKHSNEELSQFAYVASHDLQEPLRAVAGCVDLLAIKYKGRFEADADELIQHIVDGASRMRQQIQDLLALSRVGTRTTSPVMVNMNEIVEDVKRSLSVSIEESKAEILCGDLPKALADLPQMRQLFQNLIANGIKFRKDRVPVIRISGVPEGDWITYCVADNGIGIDPKYFGRLFTIFQRLHTRSEYPGTGIGLAICRKIVQRHGGRIWIESAPGEGTRFYFTVPRAT